MIPNRPRPLLAAALALAFMPMLQAPAGAVPNAGAATQFAVSPDVTLVQGMCGRQHFVCQRRFGNSPRYQRCMGRRGCGVSAGGRNRCKARRRFCARRFERHSPRFNRCLSRGGC